MNSMNKSLNYQKQLNIIRAIASLGVAFFHFGGYYVPMLNYGWLGIQMFFVLTGFVICWSLPENYKLNDFKTYFGRRLIRVEPPYLVSILIIVSLAYWVRKDMSHINLKNVIFHLSYVNNFFNNDYLSPVYWTLGIEFQFYILIGLLFPVISNFPKHSIVLLVFLNLVYLIIPIKYCTIFFFMPYFTLGILIYLIKRNKLKKGEFYPLFAINICWLFYRMGIPETLASIITALIILLLHKSNFIIDFFSKISFSLYLTHTTIGSPVIIYVGNIFSSKNIFTKAFAFSCGMTTAILFAYIFYIIIEKWALSASKKIKYATS